MRAAPADHRFHEDMHRWGGKQRFADPEVKRDLTFLPPCQLLQPMRYIFLFNSCSHSVKYFKQKRGETHIFVLFFVLFLNGDMKKDEVGV